MLFVNEFTIYPRLRETGGRDCGFLGPSHILPTARGGIVNRLSAITAVGALAVMMPSPSDAQRPQRPWSPEVGFQGGFSRFKLAGTGGLSKPADFFDVPGFVGLAPVFPAGIGALYAIVPLARQLALEPSFTTAQLSVARQNAGLGLTVVRAGLRADYAITPNVYGAAGGTLGFVESTGQHQTQLGVQAAIGYRLHLDGRLHWRVEANWQSAKKTNLVPPWNTYSLLVGGSSSVAARPTPGAIPPTRSASAWQPVIRIAGANSRIHFVCGKLNITVLSSPS